MDLSKVMTVFPSPECVRHEAERCPRFAGLAVYSLTVWLPRAFLLLLSAAESLSHLPESG